MCWRSSNSWLGAFNKLETEPKKKTDPDLAIRAGQLKRAVDAYNNPNEHGCCMSIPP